MAVPFFLSMIFKEYYCINLDDRTDRWEESQVEFEKVGLKVQRFSALRSFNHSQSAVIKQATKSSLIFEDDVEFRQYDHLDGALKSLPKDWDMVSFGATLISKHTKKISDNLYRYENGWATQAVGYSLNMLKWLSENFDPDCGVIYDEWLRLNVLPKFKCYIVYPMVCYQRPCFSDIRNRYVDYTRMMEEGEKYFQ